MIYGKGSKGNYPLLAKIALKTPLFPYVKNERSMLYVENLCEFVRLMVENDEQGTFWPQNAEYSNTSELVKMIAESHGKKVYLLKGFGWALNIMSHMTGLINKAFGNLSYEMGISEYKENYKKTEPLIKRIMFKQIRENYDTAFDKSLNEEDIIYIETEEGMTLLQLNNVNTDGGIENLSASLTNLNRQIIATTNTIGKAKVEVAKERILEINPNAKVDIYQEFFLPETEGIIDETIDYIVDAIDTVTGKIELYSEEELKDIIKKR